MLGALQRRKTRPNLHPPGIPRRLGDNSARVFHLDLQLHSWKDTPSLYFSDDETKVREGQCLDQSQQQRLRARLLLCCYEAVCEVCVLNDSTPGAVVRPFPTRHTAWLHLGPVDELFETVPAERLVQARHWAGCCTLILS